MRDVEAYSERIALKVDSHIAEADAIIQTNAEFAPKPITELQHRVEALAARQRQDKINEKLKHAKPYVPYVERGEK